MRFNNARWKYHKYFMKNVNCHMKLKQCIARSVSNEMRIIVTKHKSLYRSTKNMSLPKTKSFQLKFYFSIKILNLVANGMHSCKTYGNNIFIAWKRTSMTTVVTFFIFLFSWKPLFATMPYSHLKLVMTSLLWDACWQDKAFYWSWNFCFFFNIEIWDNFRIFRCCHLF